MRIFALAANRSNVAFMGFTTSLSFRCPVRQSKALNPELKTAMTTKKTKPTDKQKEVIKAKQIKWAKESLADPTTLIVDVETTGLLVKDPKTEVVSISMIDNQGRVAFSCLVNPQRPIPIEAQRIHGIDDLAVRDAPPFPVVAPLIAGIMSNKRIVCFNAQFDVHLIVTLFQKYDIEVPDFEVECAMEAYAAYIGDWAVSKGDWKWQKLPKLAYGKAHDSLVDCESTRLLMKKMTGDFSDEPNTDQINLDF
jgi:DNA polymerase III epsilon subunit-like protein